MILVFFPLIMFTRYVAYRNNIPRKSLNYKTPLEVFMKYITNEQLAFF